MKKRLVIYCSVLVVLLVVWATAVMPNIRWHHFDVDNVSQPSGGIPEFSFEADTEASFVPVEEHISDAVRYTSNDAASRFSLEYCGDTLIVSGPCGSDGVMVIYLDHYVYSTDSADGRFRCVITDEEFKGIAKHYNLYVSYNVQMTYKFHVGYDGESFYPILSEDVAERNSSLVETPITLPEDGVRQYISADGNEARIQETLAEIQRISDRICDGIESDYDKLRAISRWVSQNIYYDYDARESSVTVETIALSTILETKRTVCMGYANLTAALCVAQGIDCRVVHGAAAVNSCFEEEPDGELHEWNAAIIDGSMVWLDTLWDTSNAYSDGVYSKGDQKLQHFDAADEMISLNHQASHAEIRDYFSLAD